jgi:hypothetical protein
MAESKIASLSTEVSRLRNMDSFLRSSPPPPQLPPPPQQFGPSLNVLRAAADSTGTISSHVVTPDSTILSPFHAENTQRDMNHHIGTNTGHPRATLPQLQNKATTSRNPFTALVTQSMFIADAQNRYPEIALIDNRPTTIQPASNGAHLSPATTFMQSQTLPNLPSSWEPTPASHF